MTKTERRTKDFSSGLKKLSDENRNHICNLTHILFLIERPADYPPANKKIQKK